MLKMLSIPYEIQELVIGEFQFGDLKKTWRGVSRIVLDSRHIGSVHHSKAEFSARELVLICNAIERLHS